MQGQRKKCPSERGAKMRNLHNFKFCLGLLSLVLSIASVVMSSGLATGLAVISAVLTVPTLLK